MKKNKGNTITDWLDENITPEERVESTRLAEEWVEKILKDNQEYFLDKVSRHLIYDFDYKAKGTIEDVIRYAENVDREKQKLEGRLLVFFNNLKARRENSLGKQDGHGALITSILYEFEEHFNITTQ